MVQFALLSAAEPIADDDRELRACLPVAGHTVIERQAELAIAAGVQQVMVVVTAMPPALLRALDRIRQKGVAVRPVRHTDEILDALGDDDRLLLFGDAMLVSARELGRITGAADAAVLSVDDGPLSADLERVTAKLRWAGAAAIPADMARRAAELPDDWDPVSTLVRCAVQGGARLVAADKKALEQGDVALIGSDMLAEAAEARLVQAADGSAIGMGRRLIFVPLARLIGAPLLKRNISPWALLMPSVLLVLGGGGLMFADRPASGAAVALAGALGAASANFLGQFGSPPRWLARISALTRWLIALLPLALAAGVLVSSAEPPGPVWARPVLVALALPLLWSAQTLIASSRDDSSGWQDGLLHDPEAFLIIALALSALGLTGLASALSLFLTAAGLLGWTALLLRRLPLI